MSFLWYILIGIVAGYFAGKIMRGGGFGLLVNLILGIIGGVLGGWVLALFGLAGKVADKAAGLKDKLDIVK